MEEIAASVRIAREQDTRGVLALAPRLAEGIAPWRNRAAAESAGCRWLEDSLTVASRGEGVVLVAVVGDVVVGVISARPTGHFSGECDAYIGELAVDRCAVRQGVGRLLVEAARTWARDQGLANLTLQTGAFNATARAFYSALGFQEEEVRLTRKA